MSITYLDSSAFVKLVVDETESEALRAFLAERPQLASSALLKTEAMRAVRELPPVYLEHVRHLLWRVNLVALSDDILDSAGLLDPSILRTLDAIHLASARSLGDDLAALVTYDQRMKDAARTLGLPLEVPE